MAHLSLDITWLLRLRWVGVCGQLLLIVLAAHVFEFSFPVFEVLAVVVLGAFSNVLLSYAKRRGMQISELVVGLVLLLDVSILAGILFWTGGANNPFSTLFLVYVTLAAVMLGPLWTWGLALYSSLAYVGLFFSYHPLAELHHHSGGHGASASLHLNGMLAAFILSAFFIAYFLVKIGKQMKALEREQAHQVRLASLATLTAGAAHELGSPLGAIAVASGELRHILSASHQTTVEIEENLKTIDEAVRRCKRITEEMGGKFSSADLFSNESLSREHLESLLKESLEMPLEAIDIESDLPGLKVNRQMLLMALDELVNNARHASTDDEAISLNVTSLGEEIEFSVIDSGSGISEEHLARVQDPFFSTKDVGEGMGLGLFVVSSCVRAMEGRLDIASVKDSGTKVRFSIPREPRLTDTH